MGKFAKACGWLMASAAMYVTPVSVSAADAPKENARWYRGNTHAHTNNSDGDSAPDVVARWYKDHGYHFLFLTDHGYVNDVSGLNALLGGHDRFLVLSGQEITQSRKAEEGSVAHVNGLFTDQIIEPEGEEACFAWGCEGVIPETYPLRAAIDANIANVTAQDGVAQLNHPNFLWTMAPQDLETLPDYTLLEVWNGSGHVHNLGGDGGSHGLRPSAEGFWDYALSMGRIVWGAGADDSHNFRAKRPSDRFYAAPGQAWIMLQAKELSPSAVKKALRCGDFYATNGVTLSTIAVDGDAVSLTIEAGDSAAGFTTQFIGQGGAVLREVHGLNPRYEFTGTEAYVRASIIDSNGARGWTQPVFLDRRSELLAKECN